MRVLFDQSLNCDDTVKPIAIPGKSIPVPDRAEFAQAGDRLMFRWIGDSPDKATGIRLFRAKKGSVYTGWVLGIFE